MRIFVALFLGFLTASSFAQSGSLNFNNRVIGVVDAPVSVQAGGAGAGTVSGMQLQLFLSSGGNLVAVGNPIGFRGTSGTLAFYFDGGALDVPGTFAGGTFRFRVRAFSGGSYTASGNIRGESEEFPVVMGGGVLPPSNMDNLKAFSVAPAGAASAPPVLASFPPQSVPELSTLSVTASATDADTPANALVFSLGNDAPAGMSINSATGVITWTPTEAQGPGAYSITVRVSDNSSPPLTDSKTLQVTVLEVNSPPVLAFIPDAAAQKGVAFSFRASAADPDLPANSITYSLAAGAPSGSSIDPGSGLFSWQPAVTGAFSVTIVATDNGSPQLSDRKTFTIDVTEPRTGPDLGTVNFVNRVAGTFDAPITVQSSGAGAGTVAGMLVQLFLVSGTEFIAVGNPIAFRASSGPTASYFDGGSLEVPGTTPGATARFRVRAFTGGSYAAAGNVRGQSDEFSVALGGGVLPPSNMENMKGFTVSTAAAEPVAPVLASFPPQTIAELSTLSITATATDSDTPPAALVFSLPDAPAGMTINPSTGVITWTPNEAQGGAVYTATVRVTDNSTPPLSDSKTLQVTVIDLNLPPALGPLNDATIPEGVLFTVRASATDLDIPANNITFSLAPGAPAGSAIDPASGLFSWVPAEDQGPGAYSITIVATDNGIPPLSDSKTFRLLVTELNRAPVLASLPSQNIVEGSALRVTAAASDPDLPANLLIFSLGNDAPAGMAIDSAGVITWTPTKQQSGSTYVVTVQVTDNGTPPLGDAKTLSVTVGKLNAAPVLAPIADATIAETNTFTVTASATDVDQNNITYSLGAEAPSGMTINAASGVISWKPNEDQAPSTNNITVIATDDANPPASDSKTFQLVVTEVNVAPVLDAIASQSILEGQRFSFTARASDADLPANALTFSLSGAPLGMTIDSSKGLVDWTPARGQGGTTYNISLTVRDDGSPSLSDSKTFALTVGKVNSPPVLAPISDATIAEGSVLTITASATDFDQNRLAYSLAPGAPAGMMIDPASGVISWKPGEDQGPSNNSITVIVTDDGAPPASDSKTFQVTVTEVNSAPVLDIPASVSVLEGTPLNFTVKANDPDLPANTLTFSLGIGAPLGLSLNLSSGVMTWTPAQGQAGNSYTFPILVADNGNPSLGDSRNFTVKVTGLNSAPVIGPLPDVTIAEGHLLNVSVTATDAETASNLLAYSLEPGAPAGLAIDKAGLITWTPLESNGPGVFSVTVIVSDDGAPPLTARKSFNISVTEENSAPVLNPIAAQNITAGSTVKLTATATDSDSPANKLRFSLGGTVPPGGAIDPVTGEFSWTSQISDEGKTRTFVVVVTDDGTPPLSDSKSFDVAVAPGSKPPVITTPPNGRTVLAGSSVTFGVVADGTGPLFYQWFFKGVAIARATNANLTLEKITLAQDGAYTVGISNEVRSIVSPAAILSVQEAVRITQQPRGQDAKAGESITLAVLATGSGPLTYQWYFNGSVIPNATNASLVLNNAQAVQTGLYFVDVTNPVGPLRSDPAVLKVFVPPTITRQPASQTAREGADVLFTVIVSGTEPLAYQWRSNNVAIPGARTNTLLLQRVTPAMAASYSVVVTNFAGTAASQPAILGVDAAVAITTQPKGGDFRLGSSVSLSVAATGAGPLSYQWQFDSRNIPGATAASLNLPSPVPTNSGIYQVIVRNAFSTNASAAAFVRILEPVSIVSQPVSVAARLGEDSLFSVLAAGSGPLFYQWRFNGQNLKDATNSLLLVSPVQAGAAGNYSVIVSNAISSVASADASLSILTPPVVTPLTPLVQNLNVGQTAQFRVSAQGQQPILYQWLRNGEMIPGATNDSYAIASLVATNGGLYSVAVSNPGGAVTSPDFALGINLPLFLLADKFQDRPLTNGASGAFQGGNNQNAGKEPGEKDHGNKPGGRSIWFSWQSPLTGTARFRTTGSTFDTLVSVYTGNALGNLVEVAADDDGGGGGTSEVGFNVTSGTTYHFGLDGLAGSFGNIIVSWETALGPQRPVILTQPLSQTVFAGSNVTFSVVAQGQPNETLTYQWYLDTSPLVGAVSPSVTINNVKAKDVGTYTVRVSNGVLRVDSQPAILEMTLIQSGDEGPGVSALDKPLFFRGRPQSIGGQRLRVLGSVSRGYTGSQVFSTKSAIKDPGEPNHCGVVGGASSWFLYQAPTNGVLQVDTIGSDFDTVLAIYTGPGTDYQSLISVACDNDSAGDVNRRLSLVTFPITVGTTYYIVVDGVKAARGAVQLNYQLAQAPEIVQQPLVEILLPQQSVSAAATGSSATGSSAAALGGGAKFSITATNRLSPVALSFQWNFNGAPIIGATGSTLTLTNLGSREAGDYTVEVRNFAGKTTSQTTHLEVNVPVSLVSTPQTQIVVPGLSVAFAVVATGTEPIRYQWSLNGSPFPSGTNSVLTIENTRLADLGTYTVVVSNSVNSQTASASLGFLDAPTITTQPVGQSVTAGAAVSLNVAATGAGPLGFQWRLNGVNIPGAVAPTLSIPSVTLTNAGDYTVVVSNVVRSVVSAIAPVLVNVPLQITQQPRDKTAQPGDRVLFEVVAAGSAPFRYQWQFEGKDIPGATDAVLDLPSVQPQDAGRYQAVVSNNAGTLTSAQAFLAIQSALAITQQPLDQTIPPGAAASFSVTATGPGLLQYQWRFKGQNIPGATASTLNVTNVSDAEAGAYNVVITASGVQVTSVDAVLRILSVVPRILSANVTPNGLRLLLSGPPGQDFAVQASTNLAVWTVLTNFNFGLGDFAFVDRDSGKHPRRFYRVASPFDFSFAGITSQVDGQLRLNFKGAAGTTYRVEVSSDLRAWTNLTAGVFASSTGQFAYRPPAGSTRLFYRITSGP